MATLKKVIESKNLRIDTRGARAQDRERIYKEIAFEISILEAESNLQQATEAGSRRGEDDYLPHGQGANLSQVPANEAPSRPLLDPASTLRHLQALDVHTHTAV